MAQENQKMNLLRRNTAFTCQMRFRCDLPEPPSDPKLLIAPLQPEKLAKFAITSLERNPRRELTFEPGLGIHIGLMDTSMYSVTDPDAQLAPEDLALLEGETDFSADQKGHKKVRERLRGNKAELSWLMRTSYISAETESRRQPAAPSARPSEAAQPDVDPDEAHYQAVEASFEAARAEPVHAKDPSLKAVEITPVLPDFDRWGDHHVLLEFEGDPVSDHPRLQKLPAHKRQQLADEAVVKSYAFSAADGTRQPFLAYLTPTAGNSEETVDPDQPRVAVEGEYEWVREFLYQPDATNSSAHPTFLLQFEDGKCKYLELSNKLTCKKRTRSSQGSDISKEFTRPSKVTVQMTEEKTEAEIQEREKRLEILKGVQ